MRFLVALALIAGCDAEKRAEPSPQAASSRLTVERDRVVLGAVAVPDDGGAIGRGALAAALDGRRGTVTLAIAPDAPYGRLRAVVDVLFERGLDGALETGKGGPQPAERPKAVTGAAEGEPILVLSISKDAIYLGAEQVTRLADVPAGDDIPALAAAIGRRPQKPARVVLHADDATPGAIIVRAIGTARRAGIADVPFAWKMIEEPPALPRRRAPPTP